MRNPGERGECQPCGLSAESGSDPESCRARCAGFGTPGKLSSGQFSVENGRQPRARGIPPAVRARILTEASSRLKRQRCLLRRLRLRIRRCDQLNRDEKGLRFAGGFLLFMGRFLYTASHFHQQTRRCEDNACHECLLRPAKTGCRLFGDLTPDREVLDND